MPFHPRADDPPLRAELFGAEQLAHHAKLVAEQHKVGIKEGSNRLLARLDENEKILQAFNRATLLVDKVRPVTPAAEWLLDNFFLIEEQIQTARRHLPRGYSRELPQLSNGPSARLPRVYDLILELIAHVDAQIDIHHLSAFVGAYQTVTPLLLGELWAIPIMLRLALIENLRRITVRLTADREDRDLADFWAGRLQEVAEADAANLVLVVADMARAKLPLSHSFVTEFCQRLARWDPAVHFARNWVEQRLAEQGRSVEQSILQESQAQAADQVSISHTIGSLRFIGTTDWRDFVEDLSLVEQTLRNDPANIYRAMDFATRDSYRHKVEYLARYSGIPENDVAWKAIDLAEKSAKQNGRADRSAHVGYFLADEGQSVLEAATGVSWPGDELLQRMLRRFPMTFYLGGMAVILIPAMFCLVWQAQELNIAGWRLFFLSTIAFVCFSQFAVTLVNWCATAVVKPRPLPRLDFSEGIAGDCTSMVVIPTMLGSIGVVDHLLETLEIHYLSNRDKNLYLALLTDFRDAETETTPDDENLVRLITGGLKSLNEKYASDRPNIFFLFHRPRKWNEAEKIWMGYERKRGKLTAFNALLRGQGREAFSTILGDVSILPSVRFVITLDTDTQLPRDAARRLVGAIAHPLNRPQLDPKTGLVSKGYGILQPRVGVSLPSANRSWFVKIFAGEAGIDPYTRTVSDVYQDLFAEGSFIGKGIYDVDAFESAVRGRFPENTILSHDLIESLHARSALISDVELYEDHPSLYSADVKRRHRWMRGDWQIAQWLLPRVPGPDARAISNTLSGLSQWKILDNLRRSLVPAALMLLLAGSWLLFPEMGSLGSLTVVAIIILPGLLSFCAEVFNKPREWPWSLHLRSVGKSFARQSAKSILIIGFLPYDAYMSLDAILRTLVRLAFTRKRLLEWQTSSDSEKSASSHLGGFYRIMWIAPVLGMVISAALAVYQPQQFFAAGPLLGLWLLAPAAAWWISLPILRAAPELSAAQKIFLRRTARKTWSFFETFVNEKENWLPPDNFQEHPEPVIATRTSPTNIGLALLANLGACDFGYLPVDRFIERTRNSFATMERLQKYRGHFYNWYDTRTAQPLQPLYISTVDSGNLAGHLLVLSAGLAGLPDEPVLNPQLFSGLQDCILILQELTGNSPLLGKVEAAFVKPPRDLCGAHDLLHSLVEHSAALVKAFSDNSEEVKRWTAAFEQGCREQLKDLLFVLPWLPLIPRESFESAPALANEVLDKLKGVRTLRDVARLTEFLKNFSPESPPAGGMPGPKELFEAMGQGSQRALDRIKTLEGTSREAVNFANMDCSFLFDTQRELFSIGYSIHERRRDPGYYDLLASEARLGGFVAIAQGQVPEKHWFSLGRLVAASCGEPVLVSWSGSMFEYLMPLLVMPTYENTLIDQTYRAAVEAQIKYAKTRGIPWGISESGYNLTDAALNYQYRAFGVPGLGFKRGLADDLVIAPYASVMALMVVPRAACENLERLAAEKRMGEYGFYEAVDYTTSRLPPNETSVTIRSFMVHHQGMSFLSLAYLLLDRPMQKRFLAYAPFKAEELLLQERVPKSITTLSAESEGFAKARGMLGETGAVMRVFNSPHTPSPEVHLLSNGNYHVLISNSGGGYSRWRDLAVTRWREDGTRDCWGSFCYLRDLASGEFWSMAFQPAQEAGRHYEAIFTQGRAEFRQRHGTLESHVEISVSPEDDVELRRITLTNHSYLARTIEFTTYAEVVLAPAGADAAHPAFSNLFVLTEFVRTHPAILCTRRARAAGENPPWLFHLIAIVGTENGELSFETDRSKFIGRGRTLHSPVAMEGRSPLSNSAGSVLDPVVSLRRTLTIAPQETVQVEMVTGVAQNRDTALALVEKYHNARMADRLFDLAWTHSQVTLRHLDASEADAQLYARMAGALVYANPLRRANAGVLSNNRRGQGGLWSYGISGDVPIVLLRISDPTKMDLVRRVVQAHSYWRMKGLVVELMIVNEDTSVYRQSLQDAIVSLIASGIEANLLDKPGGIFVRRLEQIPAEDRVLLQSVARILLSDEKGTLEEQFLRREAKEAELADLKPTAAPVSSPGVPFEQPDLIFFNGLGGFTKDGREYIVTLQPDKPVQAPRKNPSLLGFGSLWGERTIAPPTSTRFPAEEQKRFEVSDADTKSPGEKNAVAGGGSTTPAPWVNVIANSRFGTLVSESGSSYTWLENSHEYRLTPWNNDPVGDVSGEAFYIRDEETGEFWSPTPLPVRGATPYVVRHGFGYTVFEHNENGIASELWIYVARNAPVKLNVLKLRNLSGRPRKLSVFGYWEWVLADLREKSLLHVQTEIDPETNAFFARNHYNTEFVDRIAFVDVDDPGRSVTGDRKEFLGRNGSTANPAALGKQRLSGKTGTGLDPCAAIQVTLDLPARKEREISFRLGAGGSLPEAREMVKRFRQRDSSRDTLNEVHAYWNRTLGAIQVETPDPAADVLANGWLMYQTLSARLWGRTGFYQSGGAFGFRDQLQDAMALVHTEPGLLREQILLAAAHQFREGDVQHWWHPPSGRGVRTHFSDDYLWLAYATCRYVNCLNDTGILDEVVPFLEGRAVKPEEESYYDLPNPSGESGTLYEHCRRAIEHGLRFGSHGLPLIGCGDWNDGFNLIGEKGRGESVWLAFFLFQVLTEFGELARRRNDTGMVARCLNQAELLRQNIEAHSWDGQWYRRAYFDDGEPLGSESNAECQIDSLPQSWSVLTAVGDVERSRMAMQAVEKRLVRREAGLIQLFDPPFDKSPLNPGYIKGYAPGVRENGGQYTHGAIWAVMAFAKLGQNDLAWELFSLLNPVNHAKTPGQIAIYKVEPYVVAADVYAVRPHVGRGGWTWYTGSAGWMYRLVIESLLGITLHGTELHIEPHLPKSWRAFKIKYRYKNTMHHIVINSVPETPGGGIQIIKDGQVLEQDSIPLVDDLNEHQIEVYLKSKPGADGSQEPTDVVHFGK